MVLSSAEDNSEAVFLDWEATQTLSHRCKPDLRPRPLLLVVAAVLQISPRHCKSDRQLHKLLVLVLRRQARFALVTVPEDLWLAPEAEVPLAAMSPPVVAAVRCSASQDQL